MKTAQEIKQYIADTVADGINMVLYFGLNDPLRAHTRTYKRADLDGDATTYVCENYVAGLTSFFENPNLATHELSNMDGRSDVLFFYDFPDEPSDFASLDSLANGNEPDNFSFANNNLAEIKSMVIKISSADKSFLVYKGFYPVSIVKRDQILIYKSRERFSHMGDDVIKITPGFDVFVVDGEYYINDFSKFEKLFYFNDIANDIINKGVARIQQMDIVNDAKGYLVAHAASKKDALRVNKSEVLRLSSESIISFAKSMQKVIGLKVVDEKIQLTSKDSIKKLYKLLNDDYLKSGLTSNDYETLAKNKI